VLPYGTNLAYCEQRIASESNIADEIGGRQPRHIVTVGRLVGYKGFDVLIPAMQTIDGHATLTAKRPDARGVATIGSRTWRFRSNIRFAGPPDRSETSRFSICAGLAFPCHLFFKPRIRNVQIEAMAAAYPSSITNLSHYVPLWRARPRSLTSLQMTRKLVSGIESHSRRARAGKRLGAGWRERALKEFRATSFRRRMADPMKPQPRTSRNRLTTRA